MEILRNDKFESGVSSIIINDRVFVKAKDEIDTLFNLTNKDVLTKTASNYYLNKFKSMDGEMGYSVTCFRKTAKNNWMLVSLDKDKVAESYGYYEEGSKKEDLVLRIENGLPVLLPISHFQKFMKREIAAFDHIGFKKIN